MLILTRRMGVRIAFVFRTAVNPLRCAATLRYPCSAAVQPRLPVRAFAGVRLTHAPRKPGAYSPCTPVRRMRLIGLRNPCSAQALGCHPWQPA